jgi:hypothetical protein
MASKLWPVYNVDSSVGKFAANKSDDVMLVQFMLQQVGKAPNPPLPPPSKPLVADGIHTSLLDEWILWYQKGVVKTGRQITLDGRIDRARGELHETSFTIMHLNASYRKRYRKSHDALENDPAAPAALRAKFRAGDVAQA